MAEPTRLVEAIRQRRPYASHWEWPDKTLKESGIFQSYLEARASIGLPDYKSVSRAAQDPPDFIADTADGNRIGIELTELVSAEVIRANLRAQKPDERVYRDWRPDDVLTQIRERLSDKDAKTYHIAEGAEIHVVLHTDEPVIRFEDYESILREAQFGPFVQIRRAYVLFSYDPPVYPLAGLRLIVEGRLLPDEQETQRIARCRRLAPDDSVRRPSKIAHVA